MRTTGIILCILCSIVGCSIVGCATNPSMELLESELRWMEDQLYFMDRQLAEAHQKLESCRRDNDSLRETISSSQPTTSGDTTGDRSSPPAGYSPPESSPVSPTLDESFDDSDLTVPEIELGPGVDPIDQSNLKSSADRPRAHTVSQQRRVNADHQVARIALNPRLTGGYEFDRKPGHDGVMVVVEPQDAQGNYLPVPGVLTITVTDPSRSGMSARVARWTFAVDDTKAAMKKTLFGRGIHLQMPWPARPPRVPLLRLIANYRTTDGRTLTDVKNVKIELAPGEPKTAAATGTFPLAPNQRPEDIVGHELVNQPEAPQVQKNPIRTAQPPQPPGWSPQRR